MKKIVPLLCYFCIKCVYFEKTVYKQDNKVYNIPVKNTRLPEIANPDIKNPDINLLSS